jgi:hypothetical protein
VNDELRALVTTERRGYHALGALTLIMGSSLAFLVTGMSVPLGLALFLATAGVAVGCVYRSSTLRRLLVRRNDIDSVERIVSLGRPALRVRFLGGGSVTLPTWNHDRERVFTLLEHRELPPARLLK